MNALAIFFIFLKLGATSFGGPIAHLGYFCTEFVARRAWLDERAFADLVALCQFLPGPASSQAGIALGLLKGGLPGAFLAWLGFMLPSALAMIAFGMTLKGLDAGGNVKWPHGLRSWPSPLSPTRCGAWAVRCVPTALARAWPSWPRSSPR